MLHCHAGLCNTRRPSAFHKKNIYTIQFKLLKAQYHVISILATWSPFEYPYDYAMNIVVTGLKYVVVGIQS